MVVFVDHERDSDALGATLLFPAGLKNDPLDFGVVPAKYPPVGPVLLKSLPNDKLASEHDSTVTGYHGKQQPAPDIVLDQRPNPNINGFSAALSCYPVVKQIARSVDLNTLHALSLTCRQFHANLTPFRTQLVRETLHCRNECFDEPATSQPSALVSGSRDREPETAQIFNSYFYTDGKLTTGKIGRCARDMVGECQRCASIICRNCTVKPLRKNMLVSRFRRLCSTCLAAPLSDHLSPHLHEKHDPNVHAFTEPAFDRHPCTCEDNVWLCRLCAQTLRSDDTTYIRVWSWRTRYSAYLGGYLGTGIGDGCQGVKCGRGEKCLAAEDIEVEVDCEVDDWTTDNFDPYYSHNHGHSNGQGYGHSELRIEGRDDEEPGYLRQEIVGVGGTVKQKVKKRTRVGACVFEYDDERERGSYMKRESTGKVRSWCGWCSRVIPSHFERGKIV